MDAGIIFSGVLGLVLSAVLGVFSVFFGFFVFSKLTLNIDEEEELQSNNAAVGIIAAAFIFSLGYIMRGALGPVLQTLLNTAAYQNEGLVRVLSGFGIMLLQFFITMIVSIAALWAGVKVFHGLTRKVQEMAEIRNGNIAVALITAACTITLALFLREGVDKLLEVIMVSPGIESGSITPFG